MTEAQNQRPVGCWVGGRTFPLPMRNMILLSGSVADIAPGLRGKGEGAPIVVDEIGTAEGGRSTKPDGYAQSKLNLFHDVASLPPGHYGAIQRFASPGETSIINHNEGGESFAHDGVTVVGTLTMTIIEPRLYRILAGRRRPSRGYRKHIRRKKATRK